MAFVLVGADQLALQWDVIGEQRIGNDSLAFAEVLARVAGFYRRLRRLEFLAIDAAIEDFQVKRIVWKDAELRDVIANQIIGCLQGGQAQMLLNRRLSSFTALNSWTGSPSIGL
jgi:hypothetical protein